MGIFSGCFGRTTRCIKEDQEENQILIPDPSSIERNGETNASAEKDENDPIREQNTSKSSTVEEYEASLYCDPCMLKNKSRAASTLCINCVEYLCQGCCHDHKKSKSTRDHNVLKENMPKNATVYKTIKEMTSCSDHPDAEVTHRCNQHKVHVCVKCIAGSHRKCTSVTELVPSESLTSSVLDTIEQQLQDVCNNAVKVKEKRQENIESLMTEKGQIVNNILKATDDFIEKIHLLKENELCSLNSLTESELSKMKDDTNNCNGIEIDIGSYTELLGAMKNLGKNKGIIADIIVGRVSDIDEILTKLEKKANVHMSFKQNPILDQMRSLGKASVIQDASMKSQTKGNESSMFSPSNEGYSKKNASSLSNEGYGKENASSSFSSSNENYGKGYHRFNKRYASLPAAMVQQRVSNDNQKDLDTKNQDIPKTGVTQCRPLQCDKNPCSIIGGFVLNGGYILLVDESNMNLKLYTRNYKAITNRQLEDRPTDICRIGATTFAVIYKDLKEIQCFEVELGKPCGSHLGRRGFTPSVIKSDRSFKTQNVNYGIAMHNDRFVLLSKTSSGSVILDVRQKDNNMLILSKEVNNNESHGFDQTGLALCTTSSGIIVCHEVGMTCFSCDLTKKCLNVKWRINPKISNIQRVIADQYDNFYVCSTNTGSVYKICTLTNSMKVITSNLNNPICLIRNFKMKGILVGCENDDNMYFFEI